MRDVPNIPLRAYQLWDAAGRPEGRSEEFYFKAEEEFRLLLESGLARDSTDAPVTEAADANVEAPAKPKT